MSDTYYYCGDCGRGDVVNAVEGITPEVYEKGKVIAVFGDVWQSVVEAWVVELREQSGIEKIDWHHVGGRAVVKALGSESELKKIESIAFSQFRVNEVSGMESISWYGYHPGGHRHWSRNEDCDDQK